MRTTARILLTLLLLTAGALPAAAYAPDRLSFAVRFKDEVSSYRVLGVYVLPGEELRVEILQGGSAGAFRVASPYGVLRMTGTRTWAWRAPSQPGVYPVRVIDGVTGQEMTLNVFVLIPASRMSEGRLEGYRIGAYPGTPFRGLAAYRRPSGFIRVTPDLLDVEVAPHFRLGQFVCKQAYDFPKFVVLRERLLLKLELILEQVNLHGFEAETLFVMSGYRTPFYNASIGNVPNSRHMYGDAADIFIDQSPVDGVMDDLDGNSVSDDRDADVLREIVEDLAVRPSWMPYIGGLARYRRNLRHGPFVHVDTRGYRARW